MKDKPKLRAGVTGISPERGRPVAPAVSVSVKFTEPADANELRSLLRELKEQSQLSYAQLAARVHWSRSGLHKATAPGASLPARKLVQDYVQACGLSPLQIDLVLETWDRLHRQENAAAKEKEEASPGTEPAAHTVTQDEQKQTGLVSSRDPRVSDAVSTLQRYGADQLATDLRQAVEGVPAGGDVYIQVVQPPADRTKSAKRVVGPGVVDLVHYIVADSGRTRRALLLMSMLGVFVTIGIYAIVTLAAYFPVPAVAAPIAVALGVLIGRYARPRRTRV